MGIMVFSVVISFVVSSAVVGAMLVWGRHLLPLDRVNHRSLHTGEIPRSGGLGILLGAGLAVLWSMHGVSMGEGVALLLGIAMLAGVSLLDDFRAVPAPGRLLVQVLSSICLLYWLDIFSGWMAAVVMTVVIVWSINLYNFMDGMDGLAGSMALVGFSALALSGLLAGDTEYAVVMSSIAAASAGFLVFNLPPARIFLGDVGSTFLGYMMAAASLWGMERQIFPWWVPLVVFAPFWIDATVTLLRRLARGERVWEAHRSHFYQRAVLAGWPVERVLLVEVVLMLLCSSVAIAGLIAPMDGPGAEIRFMF